MFFAWFPAGTILSSSIPTAVINIKVYTEIMKIYDFCSKILEK